MNVKVFLVDDHAILRNGLRQALTQQPGLAVVGEAPTGATALELAVPLAPDLMKKLDCSSTADMVRYAIRENFVAA